MDIRPPEERDREAMGVLWRLAFNPPAPFATRAPDRWLLGRFLAGFEGDRLVGMTQAYPVHQWFGGRPVSAAAIASVATLPERRGGGIAGALMTELLRARRASGAVLSSLYPSTVPFYRRLGFEYAAVHTTLRIPSTDLPRSPGDLAQVEAFEDDDPAALVACYRRLAGTQNGLIEGDDEDWWRLRVLRRWPGDGPPGRAVVVRGEDGVEAYAAFQLEEMAGGFGFEIECTHLVGLTARAFSALFAYFRRFWGTGRRVSWHGPPVEPLGLLVPEQSIETASTFRMMTRLLDVPGALEARGYPEVDGSAAVVVDDPLFPENRGPFQIEASGGRVTVRPTDDTVDPGPAIPIGALSALYASAHSAHDLARVGAIDPGHPALPFLGRLFSGPTPWSPDFF